MSKPNIQIDDIVREMTDEEYETLLATGWTMETYNETPTTDA
jgi:hypothetical protein